jgi:F-type H+-transporting ATPase subunit b
MIHLNSQLIFLLESQTRSLFSLDGQTFIDAVPNLLNFALLAAFMTYLLYKPVKRILQNRADRVEGDIKTAADNKASAEELKATYEQKVRDIEIERGAVLEETRKQANSRRDQILDEAKAEAQELKDRAARDIAAERDRVKTEVHQAIIDISADMAAKLVAVNIDKNAHDKLFAEAMAELEATAFKPMEQVV